MCQRTQTHERQSEKMFSCNFTKLASFVTRTALKSRSGTLSIAARNMSAEPQTYNFETLNVTRPSEYVVQVEINRPEKRNAQNKAFYREMSECFGQLSTDIDCRVVIMSGAGKMFTAGLDVMDIAGDLMNSEMEVGRRAFFLRNLVKKLQDSFTAIEECPKPVIAAVHNGCVGGGVDLVAACDIRYCTQDAWFTIKEVDIGLAADLGTLQRLPKAIGNDSLMRELAYTGRQFGADEAKDFGMVSRIFPDREALIEGAVDLAKLIASKSPVAVQGTKANLVYSRDHTVAEGMDYMITWNQGMLQSEDLMKAAMANMNKETPVFSKL